MSTAQKIGFIGLGIMGTPMAGHLIKGGHQLFVHTIGTVPKEVSDAGATVCANGKEVAQKADIIILMVPDTPDVGKALFGDNGVAAGLSKGKVVIDMSSISPVETKEYAKKINELGCDYLDAPVSGGDVGAKAGSLTIMVGGPDGEPVPFEITDLAPTDLGRKVAIWLESEAEPIIVPIDAQVFLPDTPESDALAVADVQREVRGR